MGLVNINLTTRANEVKGCGLRAPLRSISFDAYCIATTVSLSLHPLHYTPLIARNLGRISDFNLAAYNAPRATDLQISLVFFSPWSEIRVIRECTGIPYACVRTCTCVDIQGLRNGVLYGGTGAAPGSFSRLFLVYVSSWTGINNGFKIARRRQIWSYPPGNDENVCTQGIGLSSRGTAVLVVSYFSGGSAVERSTANAFVQPDSVHGMIEGVIRFNGFRLPPVNVDSIALDIIFDFFFLRVKTIWKRGGVEKRVWNNLTCRIIFEGIIVCKFWRDVVFETSRADLEINYTEASRLTWEILLFGFHRYRW